MNAKTEILPTSQNSDLVTFTVKVKGTAISESIQVLSINVRKEFNRIASAQIIMVDGVPASRDFPISNEDVFIPGADIEISAGYHSDEELIFKGQIQSQRIKIKPRGSYLIIECKDLASGMTLTRNSKFFPDLSTKEIIEELSSPVGLELDMKEDGLSHKVLVQHDTTDWDFMMLRLEAEGFVCANSDNVIKVLKPSLDENPILEIQFGSNLLQLDASLDGRKQFAKVKAIGWNPSDQEIIEGESELSGSFTAGNISTSDLAESLGLPDQVLKHNGIADGQELQIWAEARMKFQEFGRILANAKIQGIPELLPGIVISLAGVGERFNGNHLVSGVFHHLSDGNWTSEVQLGIDPTLFTEKYKVEAPVAGGLNSGIKGMQIGRVEQIEEDPDGQHRILVNLPLVSEDQQGIWCRVATLDAGNERGSFFRPEKDDEVIIGFVNGDPSYGVVLGMLHSSSLPAPFEASKDNDEKGFVTRSKVQLVFNDKNKSLTQSTPGERVITIDDEEGWIKIVDKKNTIIINDDGVSVESQGDINLNATGDLNLEGMNVNIKAKANCKAEGAAGIELSSSSTAILKGSLVQIN